MAFVCPDCKEETLSPRSAKVKVCLKCGKLVDWQDVINLLRKIGVQERTINRVRNDIVAKQL